jgi:lysophospholipase L1-like esterase
MKSHIWAIAALQIASSTALQVASLGSSYAAGPGIPSGKNYAQLLAKKLGASIADLSVSGSTLANIGPQINKIPGDADIVTLTSGGNDLGYVAGFMGIKTSSVSEAELVGRFNDVLARIHAKAPKAKIYLVEYLTVLGPDVKPSVNVQLSQAKVQSQRDIAATLQRANVKATQGKSWVEDVPIAKLSEGHGIGSQTPWVNGKEVRGGGASWHPNIAGMTAIADILYERVKASGIVVKTT